MCCTVKFWATCTPRPWLKCVKIQYRQHDVGMRLTETSDTVCTVYCSMLVCKYLTTWHCTIDVKLEMTHNIRNGEFSVTVAKKKLKIQSIKKMQKWHITKYVFLSRLSTHRDGSNMLLSRQRPLRGARWEVVCHCCYLISVCRFREMNIPNFSRIICKISIQITYWYVKCVPKKKTILKTKTRWLGQKFEGIILKLLHLYMIYSCMMKRMTGCFSFCFSTIGKFHDFTS